MSCVLEMASPVSIKHNSLDASYGLSLDVSPTHVADLSTLVEVGGYLRLWRVLSVNAPVMASVGATGINVNSLPYVGVLSLPALVGRVGMPITISAEPWPL